MMLVAPQGIFAKLLIVAMNMPVSDRPETHLIGPVVPGFTFDRAAISWNLEGIERSRILVEARVDSGRWQSIGTWPVRNVPSSEVRCSHSKALYLRVTASGESRSTIRMVTVAFETDRKREEADPERPEAGKSSGFTVKLDPQTGGTPESRLLAAYLNHWAYTLGRSDLRSGGEALASMLPQHPGLSDLASAAGSRIGIRSYASFFRSIEDVRAWTGLAPVWCKLKEPTLVEGIAPSGDLFAIVPSGQGLRRTTIRRKAFLDQWRTSGREVLIVQPKGLDTPDQDPSSPTWIHLHSEPTKPAGPP